MIGTARRVQARSLLSACVLGVGLMAPLAVAAPIGVDPYREFDRVLARSSASDLDTQARARLLTRAFEQLFGQQFSASQLTQCSDAQLDALWKVTRVQAVYAPSDELARRQEAVIREKLRRNRATTDDFHALFRTFLATRDFAAAHRWKAEVGLTNVSSLPDILIRPQHTDMMTWTIPVAGSEMRAATFAFPQGPLVVLIAHPRCHFAANALASIRNNETRNAAFADHGRVLVPQDGNFDFNEMKQWAQAYPRFAIGLAHRQEDFATLRSWDSPTFYFFRDGQLLHSFSGWPESGNVNQLQAGLRAIGVGPSSPQDSGAGYRASSVTRSIR